MKSVMTHSFSQVPSASIPRSSFDRSHGVKTTFDSGYLVPIFLDEALPGDTFTLQTAGFARMATPIFPVMDNLFLETFYFAVPVRLLWDNFQKMMGEQRNPTDSTDFRVPQAVSPEGGYTENSLQDYMGIPTKVQGLTHSALFTRAYNFVWNEWFRDQNLQESVSVPVDDGPDDPGDFKLLRRGKRHDYFTSSLPWPQKGPAIDIPLGTTAPVNPSAANPVPRFAVGNEPDSSLQGGPGKNAIWGVQPATLDAGMGFKYSGLEADLTNATAATINQLRQAFQVQKMLERDARGGTRYTEIVRSHFGVISPDSRLQRPEFLGGGHTNINITPIASTADTENTSSYANAQNAGATLGRLGAMATTSFGGHGFTKSFTEHMILIGLANVRADITYQQGLNRMWSRRDKLDYFWPALAHIGEQEVLNKEIYAQGNSTDDEAFGYQERFGEYRYKPSTIHGLFRSNADTSLDSWHLSQNFSSLPTLSPTFIEDNPPIARVIATPQEPHFIADFHHSLRCARPMPMFGVPGNIDRF
jgi:hypothetical protein